jgi:AhpD family alkylhydroperoxidase
MEPRLDARAACPEAIQAMLDFEGRIRELGLPKQLVYLVKIRASQLNGCAYCIDMHTREARASGETEQRLYLLSAWRESPLYTSRERAALAWTEALTLLADTGAPDDAYAQLARELDEAERVKLTLAIVAINGWNRIAVGFRQIHPVPSDRAAA